MADEKDLTNLDDGEAEAEASEDSGKGGKSKLILFGGIGLGAVIVGVVLALFVVKPMMAGSSESAEGTTEEVVEEDAHGAEASSGGHGEKDSKGGESGSSLIYAISDIVVNPAGTGGSRFLSCSVAFELANAALHSEFAAKEALVRDALITILSSKTVPQLTVPKEKEIVRYQIKKRLEQLMHSDDLVGVYFTDFVLQ